MIPAQHVPFECGFPQSNISVVRTRPCIQRKGQPALRRWHSRGSLRLSLGHR